MGGGSLNPFSIILEENRLTGPNYTYWKRKHNVVLTAEKSKYVMRDMCPPLPDSNFSIGEVETYQIWQKEKCVKQAYLNSIMAEENPDQNQVLKMLGHLKEVEILTDNIDRDTQVKIV